MSIVPVYCDELEADDVRAIIARLPSVELSINNAVFVICREIEQIQTVHTAALVAAGASPEQAQTYAGKILANIGQQAGQLGNDMLELKATVAGFGAMALTLRDQRNEALSMAKTFKGREETQRIRAERDETEIWDDLYDAIAVDIGIALDADEESGKLVLNALTFDEHLWDTDYHDADDLREEHGFDLEQVRAFRALVRQAALQVFGDNTGDARSASVVK